MSVPAGYSPEAQEDNINCTSEQVFTQESFMAPNHTKFSCKFTTDMLQNCSGLVDPNFGFADGKPCFIIKMNRVSIKGWRSETRYEVSFGECRGVEVRACRPPVQASRDGGPHLPRPPLPHSAPSNAHPLHWLMNLLLSNTN